MFVKRLISGILLVAAALVVIIAGGPLLAAVLAAISLIGLHELYRAVGIEKDGLSPLSVVGYLGGVLCYGMVFGGLAAYTMTVPLLLIFMGIYVFLYPKYQIEQVSLAFFGVVYVPVMLSGIYQLRMTEGGAFLVWLVFLCSWGCDTCAYCVGMLIGKHKMTPKLSPKKSVEGAIGGVVGAALLGAVYAAAISCYGAGISLNSEGSLVPAFALICAVGALISMVGDLAASAIKRNYDIKDYGNLIPGHGGILDRFDSVIFVAPVIYFLAELLM